MGENNLDDLILTEPESESSSNRGLLVILGLVVLLLILGVVLANIIFGGASDDNATAQSVKSESAQVLDTNSNTNDNLTLETTDANSVDKTVQNNNLDSDLAPLDDKDDLAANVDMNAGALDIKMEEPKENSSENATASAMAATAATVATAQKKPTKKESPKEVTKPKKVQHKIKNIVKQEKPKPKKKTPTVTYGGNIYIQVGSFSRGPSADFIDKIRSAGFKYRIKEVNGFRRVLVGPFRSASDAQKVLGVVKAKISPSAFIKR